MTDSDDRQMELLFSFFGKLHRKAPGSAATTRRAWSLLDDLPPDPQVVDFGCGSGAAALILAQAGPARVTAVDIHQPFLDDLAARAARAGVEDRVTTVCADMGDPPFEDGSFDVVWSEGAVYVVGFEAALRGWHRLLCPGGYLAVSEATWLTAQPPQQALDFWQAEYPAITDVEHNLAHIRAAGFEPLTHFVTPASDWTHYFDPIEEHLGEFLAQRPDDIDVRAFAQSLRHEMEIWRTCGESYGFVFYLARRPG